MTTTVVPKATTSKQATASAALAACLSVHTAVDCSNMAKNTGSGSRIGAVRGRSQTKTSSGHWAERNTSTGQFTNVKADKAPFKGVRKEK
jgi:hypothetical protein